MNEEEANKKAIEAQRIGYLVAGFIKQRLTEAERDELDQWITASEANQLLFEELIDPSFRETGIKEMESIDTDAALKRIKERIGFKKKGPVISLGMVIRVAAAFILIAGALVFYYVLHQEQPAVKEMVQSTDIKPGGNYALLTLGNGKIIDLATVKNGLVDSGYGSEVLKVTDGQLSYINSEAPTTDTNILSVPVGGQYQLNFSDGSRVWLNSYSTIRYPVHFGDERIVELSGEGYFEIAKDAKRKFKVRLANGAIVEVLGTHFNVNAYADEEGIKTTLLEGSVKLSKPDNESVVLKPGEQGVLRQAQDDKKQAQYDRIEVIEGVDTDNVVAWQKGEFSFKDASIESIMRQAARWYNIHVVYDGKIERHFNAEVLRSESIEKLLHLLELTGGVHFKIEGTKVVVRP